LNNETNSSPLQRLGAFFLGLLTFVGFGILAWIVFHFTGGDTDSNYEMKSAVRAEKIKEISTAQESGIIPSASDLDNYVVANQNNSQEASKKPVPGTKPFEEWMKAQAVVNQVPKTDPDPKSEPEEKPEKKLVEITINALGNPPGTMKFKETEVEIAAGSNVVLTFMNPDVLQHNLVLVNQKKTDVVGALADAMLTDAEALKKHYVPKSDDIIASTKLVNPGGSEKIEFIAPSEPGDYPFICTFPGHWRLMQGKIKVTK